MNATEGITGSKDTSTKDTEDTSNVLAQRVVGSDRPCRQEQYVIQINVDAGSALPDLLQHASMQALLHKLAYAVNYTVE